MNFTNCTNRSNNVFEHLPLDMSNIIFKEESYKIIGLCMNIHTVLGMGLKEINYKDALEMDLEENNIHYERERRFEVMYKGKIMRHPYYADFILYNAIVIEIKSVSAIVDAHFAQAKSYLSVANMKLALIVNFGEPSLSFRRVLL